MTPTLERYDFALDLAAPLSTARGRIDRREGVLVGVDVDGVRGVGEATPLPGWTESLADCRRALDSVPSRDSLSDPDALAALDDAPAARHAVEQALLDARARASDAPLARLLAEAWDDPDPPATSVPVNATVGDAPVAETVAAATDAADAGFDCLKVKVGARSLDDDVTRLRAVREALPTVTLRADANGAWDRETASAAVDAFAPLDLAYVEQPLPASDLAGHAALRDRGVAVAVDESLAAASLDAVLDAGAADVVVCKPMAIGGPRRTVVAARRARAAGVDPVVTTTFDAAVARAAAVHAAAAIPDVAPCGLATSDALASDLGPDTAPVADGRATVPDGPGTAGATFDGLLWE